MEATDIHSLIGSGEFPEPPGAIELVETHISWVLLAREYAYKIKKPVQFSFLDFSTLAQRRHFCNVELRLNQRLAPAIYRRVLPIFCADGQWSIGVGAGDPVDYCVEMVRMPADREMTALLEAGAVTVGQVEQLARILADFHQRTTRIDVPLPQAELVAEFADLASVEPEIAREFGDEAVAIVDRTLAFGVHFWSDHYARYCERVARGYRRDCHGDLHAANIFLTDPPVVFDCIEFSADFRQIDILNELAFLVMDLERYGEDELGKAFLRAYHAAFPAWDGPADAALLRYYKIYRCNVKVKVQTLKALQAEDVLDSEKRWARVRQYLELLARYLPA
jgi:uncharacterized protein